jgi:hypothetical protein
VTITCTAKGGLHGGVLTLTRSGFDKLLFVSGDQISEESIILAPNETRVWEGVYAPLTHSEVKDDVSVSASFSEYATGEFLLEEEKLTVVELQFIPVETKHGFERRHAIGVREDVLCIALPDIGYLKNKGGGKILWNNHYIASLVSDGDVLSYVVNDNIYDFQIMIIEPCLIIARAPAVRDFGLRENIAGGVGMSFQIYIHPETVSFSGISMEEIPSAEGNHTGYFANIYFAEIWYHTREQGAGIWSNIQRGNFWGEDHAYMGEMLPFETYNGDMTFDKTQGRWDYGMLQWYIQWGWTERNADIDDDPIGIMKERYDQIFYIDEYGTLSIFKFNHNVLRGTNNIIRLNGNIIN